MTPATIYVHPGEQPDRNLVDPSIPIVPEVPRPEGIPQFSFAPNSVPAEFQTVSLGEGAYIHVLRNDLEPGVIRLVPSKAANALERHNNNFGWWCPWLKIEPSASEPWISVEVLGPAYAKQVQLLRHQATIGFGTSQVTVTRDHCYDEDTYWEPPQRPGKPYAYLKVRITCLPASGMSGSIEAEIHLKRPETGVVNLTESESGTQMLALENTFFGTHFRWMQDTFSYQIFHRLLNLGFTDKATGGTESLWMWWFQSRGVNPDNRVLDGIKKTETDKLIKPNLDRLQAEQPLLWLFFGWLHDKRTSEKTSNNALIKSMLEQVGSDYDQLVAELRRVFDLALTVGAEFEHRSLDPATPVYHLVGRHICLLFVGATEKVEESKAKSQWQFAKTTRAKAEKLGVSPDSHPLLLAAIESGDVPINVFHEPGSEDTLINVEFDLWEKSLARDGWAPIMYEIAQSASSRSTYTKRVTSYFSFLYKIERYLDKHAPRPIVGVGKKAVQGKWRAVPKFVQSQMELEMDEATEEGTVKKRSALTPVADNDAGTITVPYVAMSVSGMRTTWCYSDRYYVAEEGMEDPFTSGVFDRDLNIKLNGRDDYGVMFYSLTGTDQNRGYPTFLIIMERTTAHGTRVHFHRVHPSRKRGPNGAATPPHRLIEECYRYMAGNVMAADIHYQQGDLMLTRVENMGDKIDGGVNCYGFENHSFTSLGKEPVKLFRSTAKTRGNVLGWIHAPDGMNMPHPEHESITGLAPGYYMIRRSKSWEANPTSVWSMSID